jgi:hypothetical protein
MNSSGKQYKEQLLHVRNWLKDVVIGFNFCPFASKVFLDERIRYVIVDALIPIHEHAKFCLEEIHFLEKNPEIETSLIIFPFHYPSFNAYLQALKQFEQLLKRKKKTVDFQVASFHPLYEFMNSNEGDASNYTNRSPYPIFHLLRESSLTNALQNFKHPETIPQRNIEFAQQKGVQFLKQSLENCFK